MPQLDIFTFSSTVIYTGVIFIIFHFLLHIIFLPAIGKGLKVRHLMLKKINDERTGGFRIHSEEEAFFNTRAAVKKINDLEKKEKVYKEFFQNITWKIKKKIMERVELTGKGIGNNITVIKKLSEGLVNSSIWFSGVSHYIKFISKRKSFIVEGPVNLPLILNNRHVNVMKKKRNTSLILLNTRHVLYSRSNNEVYFFSSSMVSVLFENIILSISSHWGDYRSYIDIGGKIKKGYPVLLHALPCANQLMLLFSFGFRDENPVDRGYDGDEERDEGPGDQGSQGDPGDDGDKERPITAAEAAADAEVLRIGHWLEEVKMHGRMLKLHLILAKKDVKAVRELGRMCGVSARKLDKSLLAKYKQKLKEVKMRDNSELSVFAGYTLANFELLRKTRGGTPKEHFYIFRFKLLRKAVKENALDVKDIEEEYLEARKKQQRVRWEADWLAGWEADDDDNDEDDDDDDDNDEGAEEKRASGIILYREEAVEERRKKTLLERVKAVYVQVFVVCISMFTKLKRLLKRE